MGIKLSIRDIILSLIILLYSCICKELCIAAQARTPIPRSVHKAYIIYD